MKHIVSRMSSYFPNRWPLSYLNLTKNMKTYIRRQQHEKVLYTKTARFVSNLFGNHIVGFLMMRLKSYWYNCILLKPLTLSICNEIYDSSVLSSNVYNNQFITVKGAPVRVVTQGKVRDSQSV